MVGLPGGVFSAVPVSLRSCLIHKLGMPQSDLASQFPQWMLDSPDLDSSKGRTFELGINPRLCFDFSLSISRPLRCKSFQRLYTCSRLGDPECY